MIQLENATLHDTNSEQNATPAFLKAFLAAQNAMPTIKKEADNPFFKSKYAALAPILTKVLPVLHQNKLMLTQVVNGSNVETYLFHIEGGFLKSLYPIQDGLEAPKTGTAISYAKRYALIALLSLIIEDDADDDDGAVFAAKTLATVPKALNAIKKNSIVF